MKKQSQFKPNFQKAQMNVNSLITKDYRKNDVFAVQKNKPNQTLSCLPSVALAKGGAQPALSMAEWVEWANFKRRETNQRSSKKKRVSGTFLSLWVAGKIDFLDGCDIILRKIYGKSQFNLFWRLIL